MNWRLKAKGRPIPENDIWIAAALYHGLTLVSRDVHFAEVEGLRIADWYRDLRAEIEAACTSSRLHQ